MATRDCIGLEIGGVFLFSIFFLLLVFFEAGSFCVAQAGLRLIHDLSASAFQVLRTTNIGHQAWLYWKINEYLFQTKQPQNHKEVKVLGNSVSQPALN